MWTYKSSEDYKKPFQRVVNEKTPWQMQRKNFNNVKFAHFNCEEIPKNWKSVPCLIYTTGIKCHYKTNAGVKQPRTVYILL